MKYRQCLPAISLLALACGCNQDQDPVQYQCFLESVGLGPVCVPYEYRALKQESCVAKCKILQDTFPADHPVQAGNCENATYLDPQKTCPIADDFLPDAIFDDPDQGVTQRFHCVTPFSDYQEWVTCDGDDALYQNNLPRFLRVCADDMTAAHLSCINDCKTEVENFNAQLEAAGAPCTVPLSECDNTQFPTELSGQFCDKEELVVGGSGDFAENVVWRADQSGTATLSLDCDLSSDCREHFGKEAPGDLAARSSRNQAGTVALRGLVSVRGQRGNTASLTVVGEISAKAARCDNPLGTCPVLVQTLSVRNAGPSTTLSTADSRYRITALAITLERPTMAVGRPRVGDVQLLSDRTPLYVDAVVAEPTLGVTLRHQAPLVLPTNLTGTLSASGSIASLRGKAEVPGLGVVELELKADAAGASKGDR